MSNTLTKYVIVNQILSTYDKDTGVSFASLKNRIENLGIRNITVEYWGGTVIIQFEDIKFKLFLKNGTYFDPVEGTKTYSYIDQYECNKTLKEVIEARYKDLFDDVFNIVNELDPECPDNEAYIDGHCSLHELVMKNTNS